MNEVDVAIGALELTMAMLLFVGSQRLDHLRWLAALALFLALRGSDRLIVGLLEREPRALDLAVDGALGVALVALAVLLRRGFGEIEHLVEDAEARQEEYSRAVVDYRRVARHRLANPVTAILGSARALREMPELDVETRERLLTSIVDECERLQRVVVDPGAPLGAEERGLRPAPDV
jgi:signal transduction histidine kinase